MHSNPLNQLKKLGQSVWLDYIRKDLMSSGELHRLIMEMISQRAYGFRNFENYRLKVKALCS